MIWCVWARSVDQAKVVLPKLNSETPLQVIERIEQNARDHGILLTPHERATERARELAKRVDDVIDQLRRGGQLKAFNICYRAYRCKMNGRVRPYQTMLDGLRSELIKTLAETPPGNKTSDALLTKALRAKFPWYQWYG